MYFSPKTSADGLVFHYDTGNTVRSYLGEPTTNLLPAGVAGVHAAASGNAVTVTDATSEKGPGWKKVTITARGTNFRTLQWTYISMSSNTLYCHSAVFDWGNMRGKNYFIYFDGDGTGARTYYRPGDYVNAGSELINSTMPDGKFAGTITHTGNHTHAFFIGNYTTSVSGLNDYFYYKEFQVEIKSHPTQYTAGTRSATQGLKDLTAKNTIDLSNVSFDSNAQMTFDGTNDYVTLPTGLLDGTGDFTVEAVVQADASEIGGTVFGNYPSGNLQIFFGQRFIGMYLANSSTYLGSSPWSTTLPEFTTDPVHIVAMRSGTVTTLYLNGVLKKTGSSSSTIGSTSAVFRAGTNTSTTEQFTGDIFLLKTYNRALTADEVARNFNAIKSRFNIG